MTIRIYLRRSKNDDGKQQFSLDVQKQGCRKFIEKRLELLSVPVVEYMDDGKAGDDFRTRVGMRALIAESEPRDIILCRDQSRLGRDAIEVTLAIRDLVRDRGCRLFYYVTGHEVQFENAIDQAMTFIQGTGHQMELEAVRSRTREALRSRVRDGRIAGGRCFGYNLERKSDGSGRPFTVAVINDNQAEIVRRIFRDYANGVGQTGIAKALNREGVPSPSAGKRGTGSWAPSAVRAILRNGRYHGIYTHGRVKNVRRGGRVERVKADPTEVITVEVPAWRIVDDNTWFAVQERFERQAQAYAHNRGRSTARHPLSGIAKCGECGGGIGAATTQRRGKRINSYACTWHHKRGPAACAVAVYQPMEEVEQALVEFLQEKILTPDVLETVLAEIRRQVAAQMPSAAEDIGALEAQLRTARTQQRKLAKAVALADDIPELVAELHQRSARLRHLEAQIEAARRTPDEVARVMERVEASSRDKLGALTEGLRDRADMREVFLALFPDGLKLYPVSTKWNQRRRSVWRVEGTAQVISPATLAALPTIDEKANSPETMEDLGASSTCFVTPPRLELGISA